MITVPQCIPKAFCLKCLGCCRFREQESVWAPCLMDEEIQGLLDKDIPAAMMSKAKKLLPVPNEKGEGFLCPFLAVENNNCKVYSFRPFECQLYPFLINLRAGKVILTLDLNCPYVKEHIKDKEFKEYTGRLEKFLNAPAQRKALKENPQLLQAYEEVAEIVELDT